MQRKTSRTNAFHRIVKTINRLEKVHPTDKSIIVFDIDDTLLDRQGKNIDPIVQAYHYSVKKGWKPVIITARIDNPENISRTRQQLHIAGIKDYLRLYFRPVHISDISRYKATARADLQNLGYKILLSVGDMPWDTGIFGGIGIVIE